MRNLVLAQIPPTYQSRYEAIRDKKKDKAARNQLDKHKVYIEKRFGAHDALMAAGQLHNLPVFNKTNVLKAALRSCYKSKTTGLNTLLGAIKAAQADGTNRYCYYCQANPQAGWDHYLPSEHFPEFAVWVANLVPCCTACNSTKGDVFLDAAGRRQFIHFSHDAIPDEQFVFVDLETRLGAAAPGATFTIQQGPIPDPQWHLISTHFRRLGLIAAYDDQASGEISDALAACKSHLRHQGQDAKGFLEDLADRQGAIFGRNHWRAVLLHAIAQHPQFANWLV